MPDHIHMFCAPNASPPEPIRAWVKFWKAFVTRYWPRPEDKPLWQQDCWDRQLRFGDSYAGQWHYVQQNPVRAGLVDSFDEWPYQGELNILRWHDE
jgi:putative transposase